jgi:predicted dienelactone hydrolase
MRYRSPLVLVYPALVAALLAPGCRSGAESPGPDASMQDVGALDAGGDVGVDVGVDTGPAVPDPQQYASCAPYAVPGPYTVGVRTESFSGHTVEVWYPSEAEPGAEPASYDLRDWIPADERDKIAEDAPTSYTMDAYRELEIAEGPFPVVLFSHGFAGYRTQSSEFTAHLASWGMVVVAPDHPSRGIAAVIDNDLSFSGDEDVVGLQETIAWLDDEAARDGSFFEGHVELDRLAATGHSAGGRAALLLATREPRVETVVGLAAAASLGEDGPEQVPARELLVAGARDRIVSARSIREFYDAEAPPKTYLSIEGAGHLAFSDICLIGRAEGGILSIARDSGIFVNPLLANLARDGCLPQDLYAPISWPIFHHFAVAEIRAALGVDDPAVGLDAEAAACFAELVAEFDRQQAAAP